jgi:hypothetical protein
MLSVGTGFRKGHAPSACCLGGSAPAAGSRFAPHRRRNTFRKCWRRSVAVLTSNDLGGRQCGFLFAGSRGRLRLLRVSLLRRNGQNHPGIEPEHGTRKLTQSQTDHSTRVLLEQLSDANMARDRDETAAL